MLWILHKIFSGTMCPGLCRLYHDWASQYCVFAQSASPSRVVLSDNLWCCPLPSPGPHLGCSGEQAVCAWRDGRTRDIQWPAHSGSWWVISLIPGLFVHTASSQQLYSGLIMLVMKSRVRLSRRCHKLLLLGAPCYWCMLFIRCMLPSWYTALFIKRMCIYRA